MGEDAIPASATRAARRFLTDDTTTIRPGFRGVASSVETTIIRIKHASAPRKRRLGFAAVMVPVAVVAAIAGFGFLGPQASGSIQPPVAIALAQATVPAQDTATPGGGVDDSASLTPADASAADALATDAEVKAAAAAAAQREAAAKAAAAAKAKAQQYVDATSNDSGGDPVPVDDGTVIFPVSGFALTSQFGWRSSPFYRGGAEFHTGIDLACPFGTPIYAAAAGIVTYADWMGGYGNYTVISSGSFSLAYGHQSQIVVSPGQEVAQGDLIGYVGSTGASTGPHVHFQAINVAEHMFFDPLTLIH